MNKNTFAIEHICAISQITPEIRNRWDELLSMSQNINAMYQSFEWVAHLFNMPEKLNVHIVIFRDKGEIAGIVPVIIKNYTLKFDIYARSYLNKALKTVYILGSEPLLSADISIGHLLDTLWQIFPECRVIYIDSLITDSVFWETIHNNRRSIKKSMVYLNDSIRPFHYTQVASSMDEYMQHFKSKKRYNIKRQVKVLNNNPEKRMEFQRVDSTDQVESFLKDAGFVSGNSWQNERIGKRIGSDEGTIAKLSDLADKNIFRSYLLKISDTPVAFILGYQHKGIFHYVEIGYDQAFSKFSPGTVALYLLLEDLHSYNPPEILNFGVGDAQYKKDFGNVCKKDISMLIMRKTVSNYLLKISHFTFKWLIEYVKGHIRKK